MTFVTRDGHVLDKQPWGVAKLMGLVWAFVDLIIAFFTTLIPRDRSPSSSSNFRAGGNSRGGGGGGGGGGPRGPPKPPPRRNVYGMDSIRGPPGPPPACGSCCG